MTPDEWGRVRSLFHEAVDLTPPERDRFLDRECPSDVIRREVVSLLDAHRHDSFLEVPAAAINPLWAVQDAEPLSELQARVGAYRVDRLIARGGMGAVYLANREDDFQKKVAVKVIKRGMDSAAIVQRFRNERQILAHLDHPGIARLIDGGTTDAGVPYLVMEYIDGEPITAYCNAHALGVRERLQLFLSVCAAIHYAHQNLVVHRDLKPTNILVTADGTPKLLDFGIAKILSPDLGLEPADMTATVMRVLTPEYASPEQFRGDVITTASDVYALGVVLYELLTGSTPNRPRDGRREDLARAVCEDDPVRPSAAAAADSPLRRDLDRDLDAVVLKALEKQPAQRYASVEALMEDIRRYLDGRPVTARRLSTAVQTLKFVRRHRLGVAAAAAVALAIGSGVVATVWQSRVAEAERLRAEVERERAERRFNDVRKLAGSFLFEFNDAIRGLHGALPARQLVVKRGLEYLESLAREAGDDLALRLELSRAYARMGQILGDYFFASNTGNFRGAVDMFRAGRGLLEKPDPWPPEIEWERRAVLSELHLHAARTLGVMGDTEDGLREVSEGIASHRAALEAYAATLGGDRMPHARLLREHYLAQADLLVMAGDLAATFDTLKAMRRSIEELFAPPESDLPWGTYYARLGAAQHILAVSMHGRLGDVVAERALLNEALANQQRGYALRNAAWSREPNNVSLRTLPGQCLLFMGDLAFRLGRDREARRWIDEGIKLNDEGRGYGAAAWGYHWRARDALRHGDASRALAQLTIAKTMHERERAIQPDGMLTRNRLAAVYEDFAEAHWLRSDRAASERAFREALALREQLVRTSPTNGEFATNLVVATARFGAMLVEAGREADARQQTRTILELLRSQADQPEPVASRLTEYAWLLLTAQPTTLRDPATALTYATRALTLLRGIHPDSLSVLAVAQYLNGDRDKALATALRVYDLVPELRAGRSQEQLRAAVRENLRRHPLIPLARPLWF